MNSDYKSAIEKYGFIVVTPIGTSMLPLLVERRDTVKLVSPTNLKPKDVVLYRRLDGTYVLHRLIKIVKKNDTIFYTMCGDNQYNLEKGIRIEQIIGKMEGYYKEETYISCDNKDYLKYSKRKVSSRPWRSLFGHIRSFLSKIYHKLFRRK